MTAARDLAEEAFGPTDSEKRRQEARSAASRQLKPRSWMYAVPVGYLVNVCEAAFEFTDAALDTAPFPLSSAQAMRWKELLDALEALQNA